MDIINEIERLKGERNAVVLAHYYARGEVQGVADFVGDSLALAQTAAGTSADVIVFAGVRFMAETAKILSPGKMVLVPDDGAGCSLADSCNAVGLRELKGRYPEAVVVSYVNTTAEVKALTDVCLTSSNAVRVIESIPRKKQIIFGPDRNLGAWLMAKTGRDDMILWDGACHVHEGFSMVEIDKLKSQHPDALIVAHPECREDVLRSADFTGSTAAISDFVTKNTAHKFIVVTEPGISYQLKRDNPAKQFFFPTTLDGRCNECEYMKLNTLPKIIHSLKTLTTQIEIPETIRAAAEISIRRMITL